MFNLDIWEKFHYCAKLGGEGYGSTYEYVAKYKIFQQWNRKYGLRGKFDRFIILGLPQKYGLALDFFWWVNMLLVKEVIVWSNKSSDVEDKFINSWRYLNQVFRLNLPLPCFVQSLTEITDYVDKSFLVSCEVLQGLESEDRKLAYDVLEMSHFSAVFVPNFYNKAHQKISRLPTIKDNHIFQKVPQHSISVLESGYLDFPPVPPGFVLPSSKVESSNGFNKSCVHIKDKMIFFILELWQNLVETSIQKVMPSFYVNGSHIFYALVRRDESLR